MHEADRKGGVRGEFPTPECGEEEYPRSNLLLVASNSRTEGTSKNQKSPLKKSIEKVWDTVFTNHDDLNLQELNHPRGGVPFAL